MATSPKPARKGSRPGRAGRVLRRLGAVVLLAALGGAWWWQRTLPLRDIEVTGTVHADPAEITRLTEARPDSDRVFALSPALVADRAQRAPWVHTAHVRRLPTGTLAVRVEERVPVVLVMRGGSPSGFFDAEGVAVPLDNLPRLGGAPGAAGTGGGSAAVPFDLPLLTGSVPDVAPGERTESAALRETLAALGSARPDALALVSEIEWRGGGRSVLWTVPAGGQPSIRVRIGRTGVAGQLARMRAFWDQSVLPRPRARFRTVDLRFDGQVVTEEGAPPARDSTATASAPLSRSLTPDAG